LTENFTENSFAKVTKSKRLFDVMTFDILTLKIFQGSLGQKSLFQTFSNKLNELF
jgi:hypothetical protein